MSQLSTFSIVLFRFECSFILKLWWNSLLIKLKELLKKTSELFYIGSTDKLPPPLSREEEEYYVLQASDGDIFARDKLVEHNLRLVVFLAKKYENTGVDLEDLVSIGTIGLMKGVKTFSSDKNIKLATYASRCIDNEILMFLRKNKKVKGEISFEESLSFDADGNELHLEDVLGTDKDVVTKPLEDDLNKRIMIEEIDKLNTRDREIIIMRYGLFDQEEKTQKEVADILGISQSYISRIEKRVIKRLKNIVKCWIIILFLILFSCALLVKWYNEAMVRINCKFDSYLGHQIDWYSNYIENYKGKNLKKVLFYAIMNVSRELEYNKKGNT